MRTVSPSPLLKTALVADAVVTGAAAVLQLTAASWLSELLVLPRALLIESGAFLVAYTALLIVLARSARVPSAIIAIIILGNVGWAVGCAALLITDTLSPSGLGVAFVIMQAAAVLVFATLEYQGLKASEPLGRAHAAVAR
jgi:hypothetical protein